LLCDGIQVEPEFPAVNNAAEVDLNVLEKMEVFYHLLGIEP